MREIYKGKTKDVFALDDGNLLFKFKDDACVGEDGTFDPGGNKTGLSIEGMGSSNLRMTDYFYKKFNAAGIPTHYLSADLENGTMTILPAKMFGGHGVEVIVRYRATGSFIRRYGRYAVEGQPLNALVEITLKDDERDDPLITRDALDALGILTGEEHDILTSRARDISDLIKEDLAGKGLELIDIKLEFGRVGADGKIALIDEVSAGNMRVFKDGAKVGPLELNKLALG
ncbi:MAG: phosphoribosylaminoimidazolesuccinocarboxamide synthase [Oscillospiraceae bacterium]|nr:phosphoribosylaminoimidazolesuccinocarboxamide synthase [Oscillospiraceae bacterium]